MAAVTPERRAAIIALRKATAALKGYEKRHRDAQMAAGCYHHDSPEARRAWNRAIDAETKLRAARERRAAAVAALRAFTPDAYWIT